MAIDRRRLLLAAPALALPAGCAPAGRSSAPEGSLQRIIDESRVPALGGMVVTPTGLEFIEVAGVRHKGEPAVVTKDDAWHLGSNTKAMTAALYGKLVEDREARWGATLPELFPDLTLDPAWAKATIEQVLSYTAGLSDKGLIGPRWLIAAHDDQRPVEVQRAELVAKALAAPPNGKPGVFEYANLNYILAGAAIERIMKGAWETVIDERLFQPLGMTGAGFGAPTGQQPWGHRRLPFGIGGLIPMDPAGSADNPKAMGPAGTVHAPLAVYARFIRLFLTQGGDYLKPETIAHLTTPAAGGDYALGWGVRTGSEWARGPVLAHEGSNTMWHAVAVVAPARGIGIVTVSNAYIENKANACRALLGQLQTRYAPK